MTTTTKRSKRNLFEEYPAAEIQRDHPVMTEWVDQFLAFLNGWQPHFDLPLDLRATAFQLRVWQTLLAIPYGETRSYREIAEAIGQPTAVRAVANACADQPGSRWSSRAIELFARTGTSAGMRSVSNANAPCLSRNTKSPSSQTDA